jgi:hypothetical protein
MPAKSDTNAILKVPNTPEGREFMEKFRKYLNHDKYQADTRGRKPNYAKMAQCNFIGSSPYHRGEYPLRVCDEHHVYLYTLKRHGKILVSASMVSSYLRESKTNSEMRNALEEIYTAITTVPVIQAAKIIKEKATLWTYDYIQERCMQYARELASKNK